MSLTSYRAAPPRGRRIGVVDLWRGYCFSESGRPGGDLLSHVLRRSTIGAEGFHGRVRDGIGCRPLAMTTRSTRLTKAVCDRGRKRFDVVSTILRAVLPLRVALDGFLIHQRNDQAY